MTASRAWALTLLLGIVAVPACAPQIGDRSIRRVAEDRLTVTTSAGSGALPVYVTRAWEQPQPDVVRAVVLFHGLHGRDVFVASAQALGFAGEHGRDTIVIAPQFPTETDASAHRLRSDVLRWKLGGMASGAFAIGPAAIGSFEVVDALLDQLMDRARFPRLSRVTLAGHSAGAQLLQRYAIVGHKAEAASQRFSVRYVIASPSSYLYLSKDRPTPAGDLAPFDRERCERFNHWKFGLEGAPAYVRRTRDLGRAYATREVIYLMAAADDDPQDPGMDRGCEASAQGADRFARGMAFMRYMRTRHPEGLNHRLWQVPGVAHHTLQVFTSPCGQAALHDREACG